MTLLEVLLPPPAPLPPGTRPKASRMQEDERVAVVVVALLTAVVSAGIFAAAPSRSAHPASAMGLAAGGLVASGAAVYGARVGHRLVSGLLLLAAGFLGPGAALSAFAVLPHYGVAFWMVIRQNRTTRENLASDRRDRPAKGQAAPAPRGRRGAAAKPDGRPVPPRSKRYTPPAKRRRPAPAPAERPGRKGRAAADDEA